MTLSVNWLQKYGWPLSLEHCLPLAVAHRGASAHAPENSLSAFRIAADLSAELWELDVHLSADGVCVVSHDGNLKRTTGHDFDIAETNWSEISKLVMTNGEGIARLEDVIELAKLTGCGLYVEIKAEKAGVAAWQVLRDENFRYAVLGSFNVNRLEELRQSGCDYPLSVLVPNGADPFQYIGGLSVEIVHLCWEKATEPPQNLLTDKLMSQFREKELQIVLWHEERPEILKDLRNKPVMGICSNNPEMLKPYRLDPKNPIEIVCHRGANSLAPENTLEAAQLCIDQGFQYVEIDVRTTSDGELVVIHDATLNRTTNGSGLVAEHTLSEIENLEAGLWFSDLFEGVRIPTLSQILEISRGNIGVYIEIKKAPVEAILNTVTSYKMLQNCFFWSSDTDSLKWLRRQSPDIILMAPRWMYGSVEEAIADYDAQIVEFDVTKDDLNEIPECQRFAVRSMIFSLSHDRTDLEQYFRHNPDMVNLDCPDGFKILSAYSNVNSHFRKMTTNSNTTF